MHASLSAAGYETARGVMKLNEHRWRSRAAGANTASGCTGSACSARLGGQPWGWQIDGHHLIVNCFVLGDQVVMTPQFFGSEPVAWPADAGTRVFAAEQERGLALMQALTPPSSDRHDPWTMLPGETSPRLPR